jgi:hypothetical protein
MGQVPLFARDIKDTQFLRGSQAWICTAERRRCAAAAPLAAREPTGPGLLAVGSSGLLYGKPPLEVLDRWKWIIEVMKHGLPSLILGRRSEAHRVIFQRAPLHKKQVSAALFDATLQLKRYESWHRSNDALGFIKRSFKNSFLSGLHVQMRGLENHRLLLAV